jgi:hypothetical protein
MSLDIQVQHTTPWVPGNPELDPATAFNGPGAHTIGMSGQLPIANGGTGSASASAALAALGGLPLAGGTLTGALTLSGLPTLGNHAANKTYVDNSIAALINAAPGILDTFGEIATALGDDPNLATTLTTSISTKLSKASNLSDLVSASAARTNLGLGTAAVLDVGTTANKVVQLDSAGKLPAVDGSQLTGISGAGSVMPISDTYTGNTVTRIQLSNTIDGSIISGAGPHAGYVPFGSWMTYTPDDVAIVNTNLVYLGNYSHVQYGSTTGVGGANHAARGTLHNQTNTFDVVNSGSRGNEMASYMAWMRYRSGSTNTGRAWFTDWSLHGHTGADMGLLNGVTMFINNHRNSTPIDGPAANFWAVTRYGGGGGGEDGHNTAQTFRVDVGYGVVGYAGTAGVPTRGFDVGFKTGGYGTGWMDFTMNSIIGTGFEGNDLEDYGVNIKAPLASGSRYAAYGIGADAGSTRRWEWGNDYSGAVFGTGAILLPGANSDKAKIAWGTTNAPSIHRSANNEATLTGNLVITGSISAGSGLGGGGGNAVYAATDVTPTTLGSDPVTYTAVAGISLNVVLSATSDIMVDAYVEEDKADGNSVWSVFANEATAGDTVVTQGGKLGELAGSNGGSARRLRYEEHYVYTGLPAGTYTFTIREAANATTSAPTFHDRSLKITVL